MSLQDRHLSRARSSIKQTLNRYMQQVKYRRQSQSGQSQGSQTRDSQTRDYSPATTELQATLKTDCDRLTTSLEKLEQGLIRIAVFGLVTPNGGRKS